MVRASYSQMIVVITLILMVSTCIATIVPVQLGESLQLAADSSQAGDTLLLEAGDHLSSVVLRDHTLTIASEFIITSDTSAIAQTRLIPSGISEDSASCLIIANLPDDTIHVIGITIAEGTGTSLNGGATRGGGLLVRQSNVSLRSSNITNCHSQDGGGIYIYGEPEWNPRASLTLDSCNISSCSSGGWGGGVYANRTSLNATNSNFSNCQTFLDGGAVFSVDASAYLDQCTFEGNAGSTGGLYLSGHRGVVSNCNFNFNSSDNSTFWAAHLSLNLGHFIVEGCYFGETDRPGRSVNTCCDGQDTMIFRGNVFENNFDDANIRAGNLSACGIRGEVTNCIFRGNTSGSGQVYVFCSSVFRIAENLFENNNSIVIGRASVIRTATQGRPTIEDNLFEGNIGPTIDYVDGFPSTIDARNNWWGDESGPYHPTRNPFGQGDTVLSDSVLFDPWLLSPPDTTDAVSPRPETPVNWRLMNVYPNPFNSQLSVSLAGILGNQFTLKLFDLLGREVAVLHEGRGYGGVVNYSAPVGLASGVYFLQAAEGTYSDIRKVVFMK